MFQWFKKKEPPTPADEKINMIVDILFPPLEIKEDENGKKYYVDYATDSNLDAAIVDLESGNNDEISQQTIREVSDRLFEVRKLLNIQRDFSADVSGIVVDSPPRKNKIEDIKTWEDD